MFSWMIVPLATCLLNEQMLDRASKSQHIHHLHASPCMTWSPCRFVAACSEVTHAELRNKSEKWRIITTFSHKFMEPIQVEVVVEPAGTQADPWLMFRLKRATPPLPMAVLDHRLGICAASSDLASMLGYQQNKQLLGMNLADIIPPPWSRLHSHWLKQMPAKPPPHSCRSGLTVSMLTKSNTQLPVRVMVSSKEDGDGLRHVLQVVKSTAQHKDDQRRIVLSVDRTSGCIVDVAEGSQPVFGWNPALLVGKGLPAVVDVFEMWEGSHGRGSCTMLLQTLANSATSSSSSIGESWRVGVKQLRAAVVQANGEAQDQQRCKTSHGWDRVLKGIQGVTKVGQGLMPARLQVMADAGSEEWGSASRLSIALWKADVLSGVLEVDQTLHVVKADEQAGIILGHGSGSILKQSLRKFLGIPAGTHGSDLLTAGPKGSMKKKGPTWIVGKVKQYSGKHKDGQPMAVSVQAVGKEGVQSRRVIIHIRAISPTSGSLEAFEHIDTNAHATDAEDDGSDKTGINFGVLGHKTESHAASDAAAAAAATAGKGRLPTAAGEAPVKKMHFGGARFAPDFDGPMTDDMAADLAADLEEGQSSDAGSVGQHGSREQARGQAHTPPHAAAAAAGLMIRPGAAARQPARFAVEYDAEGDDDEGYNDGAEPLMGLHDVRSMGQQGQLIIRPGSVMYAQEARRHQMGTLRQTSGYGQDSEGGYVTAAVSIHPRSGNVVSGKGAAKLPAVGPDDAASSIGDSASEGASGDDAASSVADDADRELHSDLRRAKRLKKLLAMLRNQKAQEPCTRFKSHTWLLLALLLAVHIACYVLFSREMESQHNYLYEVEEMAQATNQASLMTAQSFLFAKCMQPANTNVTICKTQNLQNRVYKGLQDSVEKMKRGHIGMYLGFKGLRGLFDAPSIYNLWSDPVTVQTMYYDTNPPIRIKSNHSLWQIGNAMINAGAQVVNDAWKEGPNLVKSRHWNYVQDQGVGVVYDSYTLSLDRLVKRAYDRLSAVSTVLTVLMVLEAFGITLACVVYNWVLIHNLARHHMLMFTSFLAMPSALLRSMASRPCVVDDEEGEMEEEEDDFDAQMEASKRQASTNDATGAKQVRMAAPAAEAEAKTAAGKKAVSKMMESSGKHGGRDKFWSLIHRMTGTWGSTARKAFKVSGRRLLPSRKMETQSMFLFVVFQLLLVIIYAVSFSKLSGLEGPVSQLNTAQHIVYRASRVRVFAVNYVFCTDAACKEKWRANLERSCDKLAEEYNALLYGGTLTWVSTSIKSEFDRYSPSVVFNDRATATLFFSTHECLRKDTSSCFPPGHKFYEVTHNGINAMMLRNIEECKLLRKDTDADVHPESTRYEYMYQVGGKDLYEATQALASSITQATIASYEEMKTLHLVLLTLTIALPVVYVFCVFRPLLKRTRWQIGKVAGLLSQLPPEVDVEGRLRQALNHNRKDNTVVQQQQQWALQNRDVDGGGDQCVSETE